MNKEQKEQKEQEYSSLRKLHQQTLDNLKLKRGKSDRNWRRIKSVLEIQNEYLLANTEEGQANQVKVLAYCHYLRVHGYRQIDMEALKRFIEAQKLRSKVMLVTTKPTGKEVLVALERSLYVAPSVRTLRRWVDGFSLARVVKLKDLYEILQRVCESSRYKIKKHRCLYEGMGAYFA